MSSELFGNYPYLTYRSLDVSSTGALIKAGLSCIYNYHIYNSGAVVVYVKLYDLATAPDETATPLRTMALGAGQGTVVSTDLGILFQDGMGIRCTTGLADNDTTSPVASTVTANIGYR